MYLETSSEHFDIHIHAMMQEKCCVFSLRVRLHETRDERNTEQGT